MAARDTLAAFRQKLRGRIARGAIGSLSLKIANYGLAFGLAVVLARTMGASAFGAYSFALVWMQLLSIPATLGLNKLLIRDIASYESRAEWGRLRGLVRGSMAVILVLSLAIAGGAFVIARLHYSAQESLLVSSFCVALILLPLISIAQAYEGILQGLHHVVKAQIPNLVLRPLLIIIIASVFYLVSARTLDAPTVLLFTAAALVITLLIGARWVNRYMPETAKRSVPEYNFRVWLSSGFRLALVAAVATLHFSTDIVMLGALSDAESVGIYRVCTRLVEFVSVAGLALNAPFAPLASNLFATGQFDLLQKQVTKVARMGFLLAIPLLVVLIVFGTAILGLFGEEFSGGYTALVVASIGRVLAMAFGPVMLLAMMLNFERQALIWIVLSTLANIGLNFVLIPQWDVVGAAAATAITHTLLFASISLQLYRRLRINTTSLGWPIRGPETT